MADDLGGHSLADLALGLGIDRQREIGMGLDVDEPGCNRKPAGIDDFRRLAGEAGPCGGDAAGADSEIARSALGSAAIDQKAAVNEDVVFHGASLRSAQSLSSR